MYSDSENRWRYGTTLSDVVRCVEGGGRMSQIFAVVAAVAFAVAVAVAVDFVMTCVTPSGQKVA